MAVPTGPNQIAIFWDLENCCPSSNIPGDKIVDSVFRLVHSHGSVATFRAYIDLSLDCANSRTVNLHSELQSSGVSLVHCPHNGRKDVADKMMIVDMLAFAIDRPAPASIVLITGDRDFAYAAATLKLRGYHVVVISPPSVSHASLRAQAHELYDWETDVLENADIVPDSGRQRSDTLGCSVCPPSARVVSATTTPVPSIHSLPDATARNGSLLSEASGKAVRRTESDLPSTSSRNSHQSFNSDDVRTPPLPPSSSPSLGMAGISTTFKIAESIRPSSTPSTPSDVSSGGSTEWEWETASATSEMELELPTSESSCIGEPANSASHEPVSPFGTLPDRTSSCTTESARVGTESLEGASTDQYVEGRSFASTGSQFRIADSVDGSSSAAILSKEPSEALPPIADQPCGGLEPVVAPGQSDSSYTGTNLTRTSSRNLPVPAAVDRQRFQTLINFFIEHRALGQDTPVLASEVAQKIRNKDKRVYKKAGLSKFKSYVRAARTAGIIIGEYRDDGTGWLDINPVLYPPAQGTGETMKTDSLTSLSNESGPSHLLTPSEEACQRFQTLISFFIERGAANQPTRVTVSEVAQAILKRDKQVYAKAGVTKFKSFIEAAKQAGVVCGPGLDFGESGWLELNSLLCRPHQDAEAMENVAFATTSSGQSSSLRSLVPTREERRRFRTLISFFLEQHAANRRTRITASEVAQKILEKDEQVYKKAGVTRFKQFVEAAKEARIILGPGLDGGGNGWLELNPSLYPSDQGRASGWVYSPLTHRLRAEAPSYRLPYSSLGMFFGTQYPGLYQRAGVSHLSDYLERAARCGIICVGSGDIPGTEWAELMPAYRSSR